MVHSWILDVIVDLRTYAVKNDLTALAEQLDDTRHVAVAELLAHGGGRAAVSVNMDRGMPVRATDDVRAGGTF